MYYRSMVCSTTGSTSGNVFPMKISLYAADMEKTEKGIVIKRPRKSGIHPIRLITKIIKQKAKTPNQRLLTFFLLISMAGQKSIFFSMIKKGEKR
jgi:hypothetical protein